MQSYNLLALIIQVFGKHFMAKELPKEYCLQTINKYNARLQRFEIQPFLIKLEM